MQTTRWSVAAAFALMIVVPACGGGGSTNTPTPVPTPTPAPRPEVLLQVSGSIPAETIAVLRPVTTSRPGSFEITLDWTFARNDMDVALARGSCNTEDDLTGGRCAIISGTTSTTSKPERLTVGAQPAGTYYVLVANFATEDESAAVQVVFTPSSASTDVVRAESVRPVDLGRWRALRFETLR